MERLSKYIVGLILVMVGFITSNAQDTDSTDSISAPVDTLCFSIVTCTPGEDVYAKFGHTALRMTDQANGVDIVFNYGCFNYNSDNFLFKFLLGQTDYLLAAEPTFYFLKRYHEMGNGVTEQVLNLTNDEEAELKKLLSINLQPENQEYRYNWLYDNCTERARDMIEKSLGDSKVMYNKKAENKTVREILHECLTQAPWVCLGVDLLLGSEIDKPADRRIQMFIPDVFMNEAAEATILAIDGKSVPFISQEALLLEPTYVEEETSITPNIVFGMLVVLTLIVCVMDMVRKKCSIWLDIILLTAQGVTGVIIAFMFFFSEHPAVGTNWQVIIFNPIALVYACWRVYCWAKHKKDFLAPVNLAVLLLFIPTMLLCPQTFNPAISHMLSVLVIKAAYNTRYYIQQRNNKL